MLLWSLVCKTMGTTLDITFLLAFTSNEVCTNVSFTRCSHIMEAKLLSLGGMEIDKWSVASSLWLEIWYYDNISVSIWWSCWEEWVFVGCRDEEGGSNEEDCRLSAIWTAKGEVLFLVMIARCMEKMIDDLLVHCKYVQGGMLLRYYLDSLRTKRVVHLVLYWFMFLVALHLWPPLHFYNISFASILLLPENSDWILYELSQICHLRLWFNMYNLERFHMS